MEYFAAIQKDMVDSCILTWNNGHDRGKKQQITDYQVYYYMLPFLKKMYVHVHIIVWKSTH